MTRDGDSSGGSGPTRPFQGPVYPGTAPPVVEDGTPGLVVFKWEMDDNGPVGPAWLIRGTRGERLFRGRWVREEVAEQYAREHGHRFRGNG